MSLQVSLLGPAEIAVDGAPLAVDTRKAVALLAYLVTAGTPQPRDVLAALLWPDYDQENARSSLRRTLSTLRRSLGGRWVTARGDLVTLEAAGLTADISEFRAMLAQVRSHGHPSLETCAECARGLAQAVQLYGGDFMAGFSLRDSLEFEDWQWATAESLRRDLDGALALLVASGEARGNTQQAIVYASRRLQMDRINESAHADLMRLYALAGDRSSALRQYRECLRILDEELGVGPLETTTALYERIAAGVAVAVVPAMVAAIEAPVRAAELPLTGRNSELTALHSLLMSPSDPRRVAVIEGEPGIGKSRLLREALSAMQATAAEVFVTHCFEGEAALAYAPVISLLRSVLTDEAARERLKALPEADLSEGARLLPALLQVRSNIAPPPPLGTPASDVRFLEAIQTILIAACGPRDGVVAFEDVHWADEATLELIVFIAHRLSESGPRLIMTWRTEEVPEQHKLRALVSAVRRNQRLLHIVLGRLSPAALRELVRGVTNDPQVSADRLYEETEGVPLFVAEYLAAGPSIDGEVPAPPSVADLMHRRLARLAERERQILTTAAVIGRSFSFDTVRDASGRSEEETVSAVEVLVESAVLRPVAESSGAAPTYDFAHERLRSFVYDSLDASRRRLLHRRIAESLSRAPATPAGQAAQHYLLAGDNERAAQLFEAAGQDARSLHAYVEAIGHFRAAIAAGHDAPAALHRQLGELLVLGGSYQAALSSLQLAAALSEGAALATIEHQIGNVYLRTGAWELAEQHFAAALDGFEAAGYANEVARVLADRSLAMHRQGRNQEAHAIALLALDSAQAAGDERALAQAHNILGILATGGGSISDAIVHLEQCVKLSESLDDGSARVAGLNNLALAHRARREHAEAASLTLRALELCIEQGDRHREAALLNNLADISRDLGQDDESMAYLKQAVALFAEVGAESGSLEPEIWKLVQW